MVDASNEQDEQRERNRQSNGQFGESTNTAPEVIIATPHAASVLATLAGRSTDQQDARAVAAVAHIDALMPAIADFANYGFNEDLSYLEIVEACDNEGDDIDLVEFTYAGEVLRDLGTPYVDFDGEILMNSLDEFGWERTAPHTPGKELQTLSDYTAANAAWQQSIRDKQDLVTTLLVQQMGDQVDALDFSWDPDGRRMTVVAALHRNGRTEATSVQSPTWAECNEIASHLTHPDLSVLARNDLSGLYRLGRP